MEEQLPNSFSSAMNFLVTRSPLFTGRKIFRSEIFAARVHASILTLTAAGTVTVTEPAPFSHQVRYDPSSLALLDLV